MTNPLAEALRPFGILGNRASKWIDDAVADGNDIDTAREIAIDHLADAVSLTDVLNAKAALSAYDKDPKGEVVEVLNTMASEHRLMAFTSAGADMNESKHHTLQYARLTEAINTIQSQAAKITELERQIKAIDDINLDNTASLRRRD